MLPTAIINKRYEFFFDFEQVTWLAIVYKTLYATADKVFVPIAHQQFNETTIAGEKYLTNRAKVNHSAAISAYWSTSITDGILSSVEMKFHVGVIEYFLNTQLP